MILVSGYHTLPGEKDYWSTKTINDCHSFSPSDELYQLNIIFTLLIKKISPRARQLRLIEPIYEKLLENCQQFGVSDKLLSIVESMVPHCRHFPMKCTQTKPINFGYKFWFGADGYPYNFEFHKGKINGRTEPHGSSLMITMKNWASWFFSDDNYEKLWWLWDNYDKYEKHVLHFDNFFTSSSLLVDFRPRKKPYSNRESSTESNRIFPNWYYKERSICFIWL